MTDVCEENTTTRGIMDCYFMNGCSRKLCRTLKKKKGLRCGSSPSKPSTKKSCKILGDTPNHQAEAGNRSICLQGLPLSSISESQSYSLADLHYLAAGSLAGGAPPSGADRPAPAGAPPVLLLLKVALAYLTQTKMTRTARIRKTHMT